MRSCRISSASSRDCRSSRLACSLITLSRSACTLLTSCRLPKYDQLQPPSDTPSKTAAAKNAAYVSLTLCLLAYCDTRSLSAKITLRNKFSRKKPDCPLAATDGASGSDSSKRLASRCDCSLTATPSCKALVK